MDYEITDQVLGRGGMGVVMLGRHRTMNRQVAIKLLNEELASDPEFVARFMREARIAGSIHHPNVVTVYDAGLDDRGRPYMAMEVLRGRSLRDRLREGPIPVEESLNIAKKVLSALGSAHAQGIFHRDVKPANIFLTVQGDVKLMDFGIATAASEARLTRVGGVVGTAEYMSPEQVEGKPIDARSDLYAFGIVLMEMLTGQVPFSGDTLAVMHRQVNEPAPSLSGAPPYLEALLQRMLAKRPSDRFANAEAVILAIDGQRVSRPSRVSQPVGTRERPPTWIWLTAGFIALLLTVAVFAGGSGQGARPENEPTKPEVVVTETGPTDEEIAADFVSRVEAKLSASNVSTQKAYNSYTRSFSGATKEDRIRSLRAAWANAQRGIDATSDGIALLDTWKEEPAVSPVTRAGLQLNQCVCLYVLKKLRKNNLVEVRSTLMEPDIDQPRLSDRERNSRRKRILTTLGFLESELAAASATSYSALSREPVDNAAKTILDSIPDPVD